MFRKRAEPQHVQFVAFAHNSIALAANDSRSSETAIAQESAFAMKLTTAAILFCLAAGASIARGQEPSLSPKPVNDGAKTGSPSVSIDDYVQGRMHKRHIPGVSIAVVQDGKVVLAERVRPGERGTCPSRRPRTRSISSPR